MAIDVGQFLLTTSASALGAFAAAAVGYRFALAKFRRERIFDKQLAWYEKATSTLIEAANKLNWALAGELAGIPEADRRRAWADAQNALVSLRGLETEAEMYASVSSYEALSEAVTDVTYLARSIWQLSDRPPGVDMPTPQRLYEVVFKMLYHAASRLAADVRGHLELPEISREWRLYDHEFRKLQNELSELRERGVDLGSEPELHRGPNPVSAAPEPRPAEQGAAGDVRPAIVPE